MKVLKAEMSDADDNRDYFMVIPENSIHVMQSGNEIKPNMKDVAASL
jgi:hypothetical protein